jgi:putative N6-adenine-specific DNA methylase
MLQTKESIGTGRFFLVIPPGLEAAAQDELRVFFPDLQAQGEIRGGLELTLPLAQGFLLNRILKVPSRVLLRLADFGCRDFPKLFRKISRIDWSPYAGPQTLVEWEASSHSSRLAIKKRIASTCADGFKTWAKEQEAAKLSSSPKKLSVYVRFDQDICWLSIDTSGEHLHKRGYRALTSEAPLRENLAAGLLWSLLNSDLQRGKTDVCICDPMAGSGTFLFEALRLNQENYLRPYAFEDLPIYQNLPKVTQVAALPQAIFTRGFGFEMDAPTLQLSEKNRADSNLSGQIEIRAQDFFLSHPIISEIGNTERWVVCNPPYGERIKVEGRLTDFYNRLLQKAEDVFQPERAGFLLSAKVSGAKLQVPRAWLLEKSLSLSNGGLPVTFWIFARRN